MKTILLLLVLLSSPILSAHEPPPPRFQNIKLGMHKRSVLSTIRPWIANQLVTVYGFDSRTHNLDTLDIQNLRSSDYWRICFKEPVLLHIGTTPTLIGIRVLEVFFNGSEVGGLEVTTDHWVPTYGSNDSTDTNFRAIYRGSFGLLLQSRSNWEVWTSTSIRDTYQTVVRGGQGQSLWSLSNRDYTVSLWYLPVSSASPMSMYTDLSERRNNSSVQMKFHIGRR